MLLVINWKFFEILRNIKKNEEFKDGEIILILSLKYIFNVLS